MPRKNPVAQVPLVTTSQALAALLKSARDIMRKDKGLNGDLDRLPMLTWIMFLKFLDDLEFQREQAAKLAGSRFRTAIERPYRWRDWAANAEGVTGPELLAFINQDECRRPDGKQGAGLFAYLRSLTSTNGDNRRDVISTVFRGVDNRMRSGYLLRDVINKVNGVNFGSTEDLNILSALYESMLREMRDAAGDSGEFYTPRPVVRFMVELADPVLGETVLDPAAGTGGFLVEALLHLSRQVRTVADRKVLQTRSILGFEPKSLPYLLCQMNLLLHGLDAPNIDPGNALRFKVSEIGDRERVDLILTNPPFGGEEERGIQSNFPDDRKTAETALLFLQIIMRRLHRRSTNLIRSPRAALIVPNTTLFYPGVASKLRHDLLKNFNLRAVVRLPKGVFLPYTDIETNILFLERTTTATERILFYKVPPPSGRKQYSKTLPIRYEEFHECLALIKANSDASPNAWFVDAEKVLADDRVSLDLNNPKTVASTAEDPEAVFGKLASALTVLSSGISEGAKHVAKLKKATSSRGDWRTLELGDVLRRRKDVVEIEDGTLYKRIRIQVKGRGVLVRDEVDGNTIGTKRQFRVQSGQFVLSKIDARHGAFGVVPDEADGAIITGNFWAYDVDRSVVLPELLHYLTRSDAFIEFCVRSSPGATNRRYLQEDTFLVQKISVPEDIDRQQRLSELLTSIESIAKIQERDLVSLAKRAPILLQSALHNVFGGQGRPVDDMDDEKVEEVTSDD
jgi:type I restriction enzyme M protein